jgi:hypothetical protein
VQVEFTRAFDALYTATFGYFSDAVSTVDLASGLAPVTTTGSFGSSPGMAIRDLPVAHVAFI